MIHVTERAKEVLFEKKQARLPRGDMALRLASSGGRLTLMPDRVKAGDQIIRHGEAPVLLVDPKMSEVVLAGKTVDCVEEANGSVELVLRHAGSSALDDGSEARR